MHIKSSLDRFVVVRGDIRCHGVGLYLRRSGKQHSHGTAATPGILAHRLVGASRRAWLA